MPTGRRIHHTAAAARADESCPAPKVTVTGLATGKTSCVLPGIAVKGAGVPEHGTVHPHKTGGGASPM